MRQFTTQDAIFCPLTHSAKIPFAAQPRQPLFLLFFASAFATSGHRIDVTVLAERHLRRFYSKGTTRPNPFFLTHQFRKSAVFCGRVFCGRN
jgi:hypothetical protein